MIKLLILKDIVEIFIAIFLIMLMLCYKKKSKRDDDEQEEFLREIRQDINKS